MLPEIPEGFVWAILILPIVALVAIACSRHASTRATSAYVGIAAMAAALRALALGARQRRSIPTVMPLPFETHEWLTISSPTAIDWS